jgi:hypothetical protein
MAGKGRTGYYQVIDLGSRAGIEQGALEVLFNGQYVTRVGIDVSPEEAGATIQPNSLGAARGATPEGVADAVRDFQQGNG